MNLLLGGIEVGTLAVLRPALRTLPQRQHIAAEQELCGIRVISW